MSNEKMMAESPKTHSARILANHAQEMEQLTHKYQNIKDALDAEDYSRLRRLLDRSTQGLSNDEIGRTAAVELGMLFVKMSKCFGAMSSRFSEFTGFVKEDELQTSANSENQKATASRISAADISVARVYADTPATLHLRNGIAQMEEQASRQREAVKRAERDAEESRDKLSTTISEIADLKNALQALEELRRD